MAQRVERRRWTAVLAMIADSEGDVDAYIDAAQRAGVAILASLTGNARAELRTSKRQDQSR